MTDPSLSLLVQRVKEDAERIAELFVEFSITDTDVLKHTLEDEDRWSREVPANSIERDRLAAALEAAQRENEILRQEANSLIEAAHDSEARTGETR